MFDGSNLFVRLLQQLLLLFFAWSGTAGGAIVILVALLCAVLLPLIIISFYRAAAVPTCHARADWHVIRVALRLALPFIVLLVVLIGVDYAVRDLIYGPKPQLTSSVPLHSLASDRLPGGILWIRNLGEADSYLILPLLAILVPMMLAIPMLRHSKGAFRRGLGLVVLLLLLLGMAISVLSSSGALLFWVCGTGIILTILYSFVMSLSQR
jgi:YidC/Oxa1 family membrane protein insertase